MIRLSSYTILSVPLPGGGYAIMNGLTGAVDLISYELAHSLVSYAKFRGSAGIEYMPGLCGPFEQTETLTATSDNSGLPLPPTITEHLLERGHFTRMSHVEERSHLERLSSILHEHQKCNPVFLIAPSFDCNYRCVYCFERPLQNAVCQTISDANSHRHNAVMSQEHIHAIYRSIQHIQADAGAKSGGQIILYGGEPLDAANKDIVFAVVQQGVSKGFHFAAVSNGHDWDHFLPLMADGGIKQIQVTIDGPKQVHDKRRIHRRGESSFDKIFTNIRKVLEIGDILIQIRVHIEPSTIDLFGQLIQIFDAEGWLNRKDVVVYANTIYSKDSMGRVSAKIKNGELSPRLQQLASSYTNVFIGAASVNARMLLMPSLMQNKPFRLRATYCAANSGQYIFAPDGHIYACWESFGKPCSRIGTYLPCENLTFDQQAVDRWFSRSTARIPECLDCPYCLVCGGGCAQYAQYNMKTLYKPYCDDFQEVFNSALAYTVEEFLVRAKRQAEGIPEPIGLLEYAYG